MNKLLADSKYDASPLLNKFLTSPTYQDPVEISLEDFLPSTLTKEKALEVEKQLVPEVSTPVAAAYYPEWAVDSNPPEGLDYSKFDVIFFGESHA